MPSGAGPLRPPTAAGGGPGSAPQRHRRRGRWHKRPWSCRRDRRTPRLPSPDRAEPFALIGAGAGTWPCRESTRSGRQTMTALAATGGDDRSPGARRHAMAEPVPFGPAAGIRLERALHPVASSNSQRMLGRRWWKAAPWREPPRASRAGPRVVGSPVTPTGAGANSHIALVSHGEPGATFPRRPSAALGSGTLRALPWPRILATAALTGCRPSSTGVDTPVDDRNQGRLHRGDKRR